MSASRPAWDHNAYYQRTVLRRLPRRCGRVLDVGCGAGVFAARLAGRADHVDAIDKSGAMIEAARRRAPANVTCTLADVLEAPLPARHYDAIVSITALHHVRLADALPREAPTEIVAAAGNPVLGAVFAALRAAGRGDWYGPDPVNDAMPKVVDPPLTTRQAREIAAATLPGVRVRRLLFWRYLLLWRRPG